MMKCVLTLVIALHFFAAVKPNKDLYFEMKNSLVHLHNLYKLGKISITSPDAVRLPPRQNHTFCVGVFARDLNALLGNVSGREGSNTIEKLRANLQGLGSHPVNDSMCRTTPGGNSLNIFMQYANFARKLYSRKR